MWRSLIRSETRGMVKPLRFGYFSVSGKRLFSSSLPPHFELVMPALSPTMSEGNIATWKKKVGDPIAAGDVLAEIETDKATVDYESVEDGYMAKILVPEGSQGVSVGTLVAVMAENEEDISAFANVTESSGSSEPSAEPSAEPVSQPPTNTNTKTTAKKTQKPTSSQSYPEHVPLTMPALSPTMSEGVLAAWRVKEGDFVSAGDILAEVETDKATVDYESVEDGYIAKILVQAGSGYIPVGQLVAVMTEEKSDIPAFADFSDADMSSGETAEIVEDKVESSVSSSSQVSQAGASDRKSGSRVVASPLARSIAEERGVDISLIPGTGYNGRITADDVESFKVPEASVSSPMPSRTATEINAEGEFEDIPNSMMRKAIAKRLLESKQNLPHYYLTVSVNVDKIMAMRALMNAKISEGKLSLNDFIVKAAAASLKQVPAVNSSWTDAAIRQYNYVDISIAVSTDAGLITPIVKDADRKGLLEISNGVKELAGRAREGKLRPEEFQGGTFTISNLGMFGVNQFSAIINPPQSAILAVGTTEKKVVMEENDGEQTVRNCSMMNVTLSCDHRVIDGAVGAAWLKSFKEYCEEPGLLLL